MYNVGTQIRYKNSIERSNQSDAYIHAKGFIIIPNTAGAGAAVKILIKK